MGGKPAAVASHRARPPRRGRTAEMFLATSGVGYYIAYAQNLIDIRAMWGGIFTLMIMAYAINALFVAVEHRVLAWHRGARSGGVSDRSNSRTGLANRWRLVAGSRPASRRRSL
jgi:hypothetical protein